MIEYLKLGEMLYPFYFSDLTYACSEGKKRHPAERRETDT